MKALKNSTSLEERIAHCKFAQIAQIASKKKFHTQKKFREICLQKTPALASYSAVKKATAAAPANSSRHDGFSKPDIAAVISPKYCKSEQNNFGI